MGGIQYFGGSDLQNSPWKETYKEVTGASGNPDSKKVAAKLNH